MSAQKDHPHTTDGGVSRRRIIGTAATAAWTAPVIVAASGTPASAAAGSGQALIVTPPPTYTPVFQRIRASSRLTNNGSGTPGSMPVTVTIRPTEGMLADQDPVFVDDDFAFVSRMDNLDGSRTLNFVKVAPQIAPGQAAFLTFDFIHIADDLNRRTGNVTVVPAPDPGTAVPGSSNYSSSGPGDPPTGAAAIVAGGPSTTAPTGSVRVQVSLTNCGTVAPSSMDVDVRLSPIVGTIEERDPTVNNTLFTFAGRVQNPDGGQTLTFRKVDPQIGPDETARLQFSFFPVDGAEGLKKGTITVTPSVPAPGTTTPSAGDYE
jgi:hypothetical protein